ncbi:conjugative transposon protein TraN [Panacibacter ginsenosidivorans]|uniref:Conjugative transposon protein TraN n=1 Tax=Panacibacter ginsenosidivorans TaxID=1813871 RepID=A0A5B8VD77_9BACT|nr:conjugative transposon protein TraN [Panacibacter ginsenosidivorans]QEC69272.1 conjugative transposon protein TraN [Panacibacter ginsenosidivorans]
MKRYIGMLCLCGLVMVGRAQTVTYATLQLTTNKTTTLVFPAAVKPADLGSKDILAQKAPDNENILFLKAATAGFRETNLTVITADGKLYTFTVLYDSMPAKTVYNIAEPQAVNRNEVSFGSGRMNPASAERISKRLLQARRLVHGIAHDKGDIRAVVSGIYIKENLLFLQLSLENVSSINYDIDFIRFSIQDKKIAKRTAAQQVEMKPVCTAGNNKRVRANSSAVAVFAFEKFTIPDAKSFIIQIGEAGGGRHLQLRVKNRNIIHAVPVDELRIRN